MKAKPAHGGRRRGAGSKPQDPAGRGKSYGVYLTPSEQATCLRHGATVQEGLRRLVRAANEATNGR